MKIRCSYCGTEHSVPIFYLKILNIFKTDYSFICQKCFHYNNRLMRFWTVHNVNEKEKSVNKLVEAQKYELYKN